MDTMTSEGDISKKPWETDKPIQESLRNVIGVLGKINEFSELLTRLAVRERAIRNGKSPQEATDIAVNMIDFSQGGSFTKALNNGLPYLNAAVQGTRGVIGTFQENPGLATFKAAQIITFAYGLRLMWRILDEEGYEKTSDREKEGKWVIPIPGMNFEENGETRHHYLAISKDQGQRIFASIGEGIADIQAGENPEDVWPRVKMALEEYLPVTPESIGSRIPMYSAIQALYNNRDEFLKRDIWKGPENAKESSKYNEDTRQLYIDVGTAMGLSPQKLEVATEKLIPKNLFTDLMLSGYDEITNQLPEKEKRDLNKPLAKKFSENSITGKVFRTTYPKKQYEDDIITKARNYKIDLYNDDKTERNTRELKRDVDSWENERNTLKNQNDREFNRLYKQGRKPVIDWLKTISEKAKVEESRPKKQMYIKEFNRLKQKLIREEKANR